MTETATPLASVVVGKCQTVYLRHGGTKQLFKNPVIRTVYTDGRRFWIGAPEGGEDATYVMRKYFNAGTKMRKLYWEAK